MFNFAPAEGGKADETGPIAQFKNNHEAFPMSNEPEYHELPQQYVRENMRFENNIPLNLPSAFFNSKKFNFEGFPNAYEEDKFNEFSNAGKKKLKQGQ